MDSSDLKITPIAPYTVVHDVDENRVLMRIAGVVSLPVGAEIELVDPNINVMVVRVRLLASPGDGQPMTVCLDVRRPPAASWERATKRMRIVKTRGE
jgi:hypothetical protein